MAGGVAEVPDLAQDVEDGAVAVEVAREGGVPVVADDEEEAADVEHVPGVVAAGAGGEGGVVSLPAQGGEYDVRRLPPANAPQAADDEFAE